MPACGCPDVKLEDGSIRKCACQPCSSGDLNACSCNKETGCACQNNPDKVSACVCGDKCTCSTCACAATGDLKKVGEAPRSCCSKRVEEGAKSATASS